MLGKGNAKGAWWGAYGVFWQRAHTFFFQVFLKLICGKGRTRRFPSDNQ
jgi:hypothetical protein